MSVNKVVYGTTVLVDLTEDTVTADTLLKGATAHNAAGELITGTASGGSSLTITVTVDSGATVTATKGDLSVTGVSENGTCVLTVPELGTWTVTATKDGKNKSTEVEVTTDFPATIVFDYTLTLEGTFKTTISTPNHQTQSVNLVTVTIDEIEYTSAQEVNVQAGTNVMVTVSGSTTTAEKSCYIKFDGKKVLSNSGGSYNFTPTTDCTITATIGSKSMSSRYGMADIVTNGEAQATSADLDMLL